MLINNAGIVRGNSILSEDSLEQARAEFETNVWGPFNMSRGFAPVLAKNGGGAIVNVLSVAAWLSVKEIATYAMSKSAAWSLTNGLRLELAEQNTLVVAVHAGFIDTDMAANVKADKVSTFQVVERTLDAVEAGMPEVLADDGCIFVKNNLPNHIETFYPLIARHD
jgi:NAD(P)-dependent dehydrogenase (short-subunit alcohol dehydrogenase family)